ALLRCIASSPRARTGRNGSAGAAFKYRPSSSFVTCECSRMGNGMHTGSCLCGVVRFTVEGELKPPDACHCTICRKTSGHYYSGTDIPRERVTIEGEDNVTWYRSSEKVRRGFC